MARDILHCDLNNFFASVSLLSRPELKDRYVVIGGDEAARSGIVLAKNEKAKKMGVKTAEPLWQARAKCPDLVVLPSEFHLYSKYSKLTRAIYERYTDLVEPFSIDECWLDVTGSSMLFGSAEEIAKRINREVREELGITVSIGVSFNKVFAKLGSDMKKPDGITVITPENYKEKVWPLPVSDLLFIGRQTERKLASMGISTIGQLAMADIGILRHNFGKNAALMHIYANGADKSPVIRPEDFEEQKSISNTVTLPADIYDNEAARGIFVAIAENIGVQLRKASKVAKNIGIIVKDCDLAVFEHASAMQNFTQSTMTIADMAYALFCDYWKWEKPVRMLGIKAYNLYGECDFEAQIDFQGNVFSDEKHKKADTGVDSIRDKFGAASVRRGSTLNFDGKGHGPGFPRQK